jgi:hypothetical protein
MPSTGAGARPSVALDATDMWKSGSGSKVSPWFQL